MDTAFKWYDHSKPKSTSELLDYIKDPEKQQVHGLLGTLP
jgi:hypothetical protein